MRKLEDNLGDVVGDISSNAEAIGRTPVRSMADLRARLEVAEWYCTIEPEEITERAALELISAVRTLIEGGVHA